MNKKLLLSMLLGSFCGVSQSVYVDSFSMPEDFYYEFEQLPAYSNLLKQEHLKFKKLLPGRGVNLHDGYRVQRVANGIDLEVLKDGKKIKTIKHGNIDTNVGIWNFRLLEDNNGRKFVTYYTSPVGSWKDLFNIVAIEDPQSAPSSVVASSSVAGPSSAASISAGDNSYDDQLSRREEQHVAQYVLSPNSLGLGNVVQRLQFNRLHEGRGFGLSRNHKLVREGNDLVFYKDGVELDRVQHRSSDRLENFRLFEDQDGRKFVMYTRVAPSGRKHENAIAPFEFVAKVLPPNW